MHRGAVLGTVVGATFGASGLPKDLLDGLVHRQELQEEIRAFLAVVARLRREARTEL